jgi:hypothetical protein
MWERHYRSWIICCCFGLWSSGLWRSLVCGFHRCRLTNGPCQLSRETILIQLVAAWFVQSEIIRTSTIKWNFTRWYLLHCQARKLFTLCIQRCNVVLGAVLRSACAQRVTLPLLTHSHPSAGSQDKWRIWYLLKMWAIYPSKALVTTYNITLQRDTEDHRSHVSSVKISYLLAALLVHESGEAEKCGVS